MEQHLSLPPFTMETALEKVQMAGEAVKEFLKGKWGNELDYKLKKELWGFRENWMAVRFEYEYRTAESQWFRAYGI